MIIDTEFVYLFQCTPNELTNGVITACFMLLFKDLIRLFACYNDGIINLLGRVKYFYEFLYNDEMMNAHTIPFLSLSCLNSMGITRISTCVTC